MKDNYEEELNRMKLELEKKRSMNSIFTYSTTTISPKISDAESLST